ncbi:MAG: hypothetical protein ACOX1X_06120 [Dethiobacteria bacterium]|jgi:methyl-accepting chemotaxis protein
MSGPSEIDFKLDRILNSLRQNRYKLEQILITLQVQQQTMLDSLQKIMEEQLVLQGALTGSLSQFEEKAGASQGLQGLFSGNPLLKNEIMQKRVALEQNVLKLREMGYQLQQKMQQLGKSMQDIGRYVAPEIEQQEKSVEEVVSFLAERPPAALLLEKN